MYMSSSKLTGWGALTSPEWWKAAAVRAVKTAAQSFVAAAAGATVLGDLNWAVVGSTVALAAILSLATSIGGIPEVTDGTTDTEE